MWVSLLWKGSRTETTRPPQLKPWLIHLVPNGLSASRVALAAAFPFAGEDARVGIVAAAALSDALDGFAARLLRAESDVGRLLDPLADKFFVLVLVGTLIAEGTLHPLWALGLAARDVVVTAGVLYVTARRQWARGRRMRPSLVGKATTAAQFAVLLVLVVWGNAATWLLAAVALGSAAAAADYGWAFLRPRADRGPSSECGAWW